MLPFQFWFRSLELLYLPGLNRVWWLEASRQDLDAKATQAAREAQSLPPGSERIEAMKRADGLRHAADTCNYLFPANSNGKIDRIYRRQPPRGRRAFCDAHSRGCIFALS
jgi:hypothetical protein